MRFAASLLCCTLAAMTGCGLALVGGGDGENDEALGGDNADNGDAASHTQSQGDGATSSPDIDGAVTTTTADGAPKGPDAEAGPVGPVGPVAPVFGEDCLAGTIYEDDFSFDPAGRWFPVAATWTWSQTNKTYTVSNVAPHGVIWIGPRPKWKDYVIEASIRVAGPVGGGTHGNGGPLFRILNIGTPPITNDEGQMYIAGVVLSGDDQFIFGTENDGWTQNAQTSSGSFAENQWGTVRVEMQGSSMKFATNGTQRIAATNTMFAAGSVGFKAFQIDFAIRSVKITCL